MPKKQGENSRVEVIVPPGSLMDRVKVIPAGSSGLTPVQRAEKALEELSVEFDGWLVEEVNTLTKARDLVREQGLTEDTFKKLHHAAHDLKGQGETYGYPLITMVCSILCKLLESATQLDLIPFEIIDQHVNAVRNMMNQKVKADNHPLGLAIYNKLYDVVMEFADHEDKKRAQLSKEQDSQAD